MAGVIDGDVYLRRLGGDGLCRFFIRQQRDAVQAHISGDRRFERIIIGNERLFFVGQRIVCRHCGGDGGFGFDGHIADRIDQADDVIRRTFLGFRFFNRGFFGFGFFRRGFFRLGFLCLGFFRRGFFRLGGFQNIRQRFIAAADGQRGKGLRVAREGRTAQRVAILKSVHTDFGDRFGQIDLLQLQAAFERMIADALQRIGQANGFQIFIFAIEGGIADGGDLLFHRDGTDFQRIYRPGLAILAGIIIHFAVAGNGQIAIFGKHPNRFFAAGAVNGVDAFLLLLRFFLLRGLFFLYRLLLLRLLLRGLFLLGFFLLRLLLRGLFLHRLFLRGFFLHRLFLRGFFLLGFFLLGFFLRGFFLRRFFLHRFFLYDFFLCGRFLHDHRFRVLRERAGGHAQQHGERQHQCQQASFHDGSASFIPG